MGDQTFIIHVMIMNDLFDVIYKFYNYSSGANNRFYVK